MVVLYCAHRLPACRTHALWAALTASAVGSDSCRRPQSQAARSVTAKGSNAATAAAANITGMT